MKSIFLVLLGVFFLSKSYGYLPMIEHYSFTDYEAGPENWGIDQNETHELFFANQLGLLSFNGADWQLYKEGPNRIKSVFYDELSQRTYVGAMSDFGYFITNKNHQSEYHSIKKEHNIKLDKDIWKIEKLNNTIVFQSENNIYLYTQDGELKSLPFNGFVRALFKIKERLFLVDVDRGLLELKNNELVELSGGELFANDKVNVILPFSDGELLIIKWADKKLYKYDFKVAREWHSTKLIKLLEAYPFVGIKYGEDFALGTTQNGFYLLSEEGDIKANLNVNTGLRYNKIFNVYEDHLKNLWIGYEDGIDKISYQLPLRFINKLNGVPGNAFDAKVIDDELFLLTSTGTYVSPFVKNQSTLSKSAEFKIWNGQVRPTYWIEKVNNAYYWGDLYGAYKFEDGIVTAIVKSKSCLASYPILEHYGHYLVSFNDFLCIINFINGKVVAKTTKIKGVKQIIYCKGKYWAVDEFDRLLSFVVDEKEPTIYGIEYYSSQLFENGSKQILNYNNNVYLASEKQLYNLSKAAEADSVLKHNIAAVFGEKIDYSKVFYPHRYFDSAKLQWVLTSELNTESKMFYKNVTKHFFKNHVEFVSKLDDSRVCLGGFGGFCIIDLNQKPVVENNSKILLKHLSCINSENNIELNYDYEGRFKRQIGTKKIEIKPNSIPYDYNDIYINVSNTNYVFPSDITYKFELLGTEPQIIDFSSDSKATFLNVQPGEYRLVVTAKDIFNQEITKEILKFRVLPPWYQSLLFYIFLVSVLVTAVILVFRIQLKLHASREQRLAEEVSLKTAELNKRNDSLTSSIRYAKLIKDAHLSPVSKLEKVFKDHFILIQPKDIVGGDFYWFEILKDRLVMCVADCTGHGVPGGFMSILSINKLRNIVRDKGEYKPSEILHQLNEHIILALNKSVDNESVLTDGLDIACVSYHLSTKKIEFAGANRNLTILSNNKLTDIRGDRKSIGDLHHKKQGFENHELQLQSGDSIYLYSDGVTDQFGGVLDKKFGKRNLDKLIKDMAKLTMREQKNNVGATINGWKGQFPQTDDILFVGVKI